MGLKKNFLHFVAVFSHWVTIEVCDILARYLGHLMQTCLSLADDSGKEISYQRRAIKILLIEAIALQVLSLIYNSNISLGDEMFLRSTAMQSERIKDSSTTTAKRSIYAPPSPP